MECNTGGHGETDKVSLVRKVSGGDRASFEALYRELFHRVYGFVRMRMDDDTETSDIVQEVFLAVWRGAGRFDGQSKVLTWVLGIAGNKVADHYRRRKGVSGKIPVLEELTEDTPDLSGDFVEGVHAGMELETLLKSLPPGDRELLHLVFAEGLSYTEVAQVLRIPEGTVKSRMFHIRERLRKQMLKHSEGGAYYGLQ